MVDLGPSDAKCAFYSGPPIIILSFYVQIYSCFLKDLKLELDNRMSYALDVSNAVLLLRIEGARSWLSTYTIGPGLAS